MAAKLKILFVDDHPTDVELAKQTLTKEGIKFQSRVVQNETDFIHELEKFEPDIILSDFSMPQFSGLRALNLTLEKCPATPFILLTCSVNEEIAVECMKNGATDYIIKEHIARLPLAVKDALEKNKIILEKEKITQALKENEDRYRDLVENSSDLICTHDLDGNVLSVNSAALKITGYSQEEVLKMNLQDIIVPEYRKVFNAYLKKIQTNGYAHGLMIIQTKTGERRIWEYNNSLRTHGIDKPLVRGMVEDITERVLAEKAIRVSEEKYRSLIDSMNEGVFITDEKGIFTFANNALAHIHGFDNPQELLNKYFTEFIEPTEKDEIMQRFITAMQPGEVSPQLELQIVRKDGSLAQVQVRPTPVIKGERIVGSVGIVLDITERKHAEKALRENEERLRTIIETEPECVKVVDRDGQLLEMNAAGLAMLEAESLSEVQQHTLFNFILPEYHAPFIALHKRVMSGENGILEFEVMGLRGTRRWLETHAAPMRDETGEVTKLLGVTRDITERKHAEMEREQYYNFFQSSTDLMCITDPNGAFKQVNPSCSQTLGYSETELLTKPFIEFVHPDDKQLTLNEMSRQLQRGFSFNFENRYICKDGSVRWLSWLAKYNKDEGITYATARDVTQRKRAEEEIVMLAHSLRSINESVIITDVEDKILFVNESLLETYGYDENELNGKHISILRSLNNPPELVGEIMPATKRGGWKGELWNKRKDGSEFQISLSTTIIRDKNGKSVALIGVASDITERKHAEETLKKSEESYRYIVEATNAVLYHLKYSTMKYDYIHHAIEKLIGYTPEELNEIGFKNIIVKISRYHVEKVDINLIVAEREHGKTPEWQADYQVRTKDGRLIWLSDHSYPWKDETGNLIGSVGILSDITERKHAEEILSNERTLLRTILDLIPDAIYVKDINGRKILANRTEIQLSGRKREDEVIGKTDFDLYPENEAKRFNDEDQTVIHSGKPLLNMESSLVDKDGQIHWLLGAKVPLRDVHGEITGIVGVNHDFTERKLAEEELLKLSLAVEQSPASVIITNLQGDIEYVNNKFCLVTGYSKEEAIGQNPRILKSGIQDQKFYEELWNTILLGREWQGEFLDKKKNGDLFWESALISPLVNKEGKITHFLAVKEDITDKKKMVEELIIAKEKAEEMNRLKSNFLANMSHELRTPLNGIMGYADILTSQLEEPELIEMAQGIFDSGKRLSETLNFILDLSEAETVKVEEVAKDIAVIPLVKNSIKSFSKEIAKRGLQLETVVKDENIYAHLEEHLFNRVLYNLLDNAIKFTKKGKISVEIGKEVIVEKAWLYVKIKDTGIGIAPDKIDLIWDEFRQVSEGLSRSFEGAGLGLTISKKAVELMHGVIFVESELGVGSTFTVKFPAVSFLPQKEELIQTKDDTGFQSKQEKVETADLPLVLCVEDDYVNSHIVKLYLKNICRVDTAESMEKALLLAAEKKYELILMDINLGEGVSGMEVVKEIVKMPQYLGTPIIAVTAYAMEKDKAEFLKGGCTDYISKPYQKEELIDLVTSVLKNR